MRIIIDDSYDVDNDNVDNNNDSDKVIYKKLPSLPV